MLSLAELVKEVLIEFVATLPLLLVIVGAISADLIESRVVRRAVFVVLARALPVLAVSRVMVALTTCAELLVLDHAKHFSFGCLVVEAGHAHEFDSPLTDSIFEVFPLGLVHNEHHSVVHRELLI